jgi:hypothetical protein
MWRGTDDVGIFLFGRFRHFDRLVIRRFDRDDTTPAGIEADLLGGAA